MSEARTEITEADRLLAEPVLIEHPAGRQVGLLFTMTTMARIERLFGSMVAFEEQLNAVLEQGLRAPIVTFIARALDALLPDDPPSIRDNRADCLAVEDLGPLATAISRAWQQFWPAAEATDARPNPNGAQDAPSPGGSGTTSPSSDSDLTPAASGA